MQIIPAILTQDPLELDLYLRKVRDSKKFDKVQIDFIDGKFVNNITIRPAEVDLIPYLPLKFDAHLMVVEDNQVARTHIKDLQSIFQYSKFFAEHENLKDFYPLTKIREAPLFQEKRSSSVLQLADFSAYMMKRHVNNKEDPH